MAVVWVQTPSTNTKHQRMQRCGQCGGGGGGGGGGSLVGGGGTNNGAPFL